jgi:hypothetical protein
MRIKNKALVNPPNHNGLYCAITAPHEPIGGHAGQCDLRGNGMPGCNFKINLFGIGADAAQLIDCAV